MSSVEFEPTLYDSVSVQAQKEIARLSEIANMERLSMTELLALDAATYGVRKLSENTEAHVLEH